MTQHIHAENMRLYAEDATETDTPWERWEVLYGAVFHQESTHPTWNPLFQYRRIDPYRELKEAAKDPTKQIRCIINNFIGPWIDGADGREWEFTNPVNCYKIRDKPVEKKLVKYLCYESDGGSLYWVNEKGEMPSLSHVPELDKEVWR